MTYLIGIPFLDTVPWFSVNPVHFVEDSNCFAVGSLAIVADHVPHTTLLVTSGNPDQLDCHG